MSNPPRRANYRRKLAHVVFGSLHFVEDARGGRTHALAGRREHHLLSHPGEERRLKPVLDVTELVAERRLGQVEALGGAGHAAAGSDGLHEPQVTKIEIHGMNIAHRSH